MKIRIDLELSQEIIDAIAAAVVKAAPRPAPPPRPGPGRPPVVLAAPAPGPGRLHRPRDVARRLGVSGVTLWRLRRNDPTFPAPVRIGTQAIAFRESDVEAWITARQRPR